MKTTEHGIENSRDVENIHHMRLMALLQELVREKGYKGAARVLEIDPQTVTDSAKTGRLSRRTRDALERALQEGVGSAAERQRRRNEELEGRLKELEESHDALGKEVRKRLATLEGRSAFMPGGDPQRTGAGHAGAGPSPQGEDATGVGSRRPPTRPSIRREHPDLATLAPADDDEEIFGEAWPLIVEWRGLRETHPNDGGGLAWLTDHVRLLEVELALLEEHGLTLPPEKQPLRGLDRSGQISWRRAALFDTRRERRRAEVLDTAWSIVTLRFWRR